VVTLAPVKQLGGLGRLAHDALLGAAHAPGDGRAADAQRLANLGVGEALVAKVGDEQLDGLEVGEDLGKELAVDHPRRNGIEHLFYSSDKKKKSGAARDENAWQARATFIVELLSPENSIRDTQISIEQNLDFVTAIW
jgi:hypothetical protein